MIRSPVMDKKYNYVECDNKTTMDRFDLEININTMCTRGDFINILVT